MHIPDALLQGKICPVTCFISAAGIAAAVWSAVRQGRNLGPARFGAVAALIFAAQTVNFPVLPGVSGHLVGGVLAARLLGLPLGILALSLVIAIQSLVFSDGGVAALGANIFNMAILATAAGDRVRVFLDDIVRRDWLATSAAAWISVMAGAAGASFELAVSGGPDVVAPMLAVHALIGAGEAAMTLAISFLLSRIRQVMAPLAMAVFLALLISPFASTDPDGFAWIVRQAGFSPESPSLYLFRGVRCGALSTALAVFSGVLATFCLAGFCGFLETKIPRTI